MGQTRHESKMKRRPDRFLLIAIWEFLSAVCCPIGIAALLFLPSLVLSGYYGVVYIYSEIGVIFSLSIAIFFLVCCAGLSMAGGFGLLLGKPLGVSIRYC
jgi:hypothetical protein